MLASVADLLTGLAILRHNYWTYSPLWAGCKYRRDYLDGECVRETYLLEHLSFNLCLFFERASMLTLQAFEYNTACTHYLAKSEFGYRDMSDAEFVAGYSCLDRLGTDALVAEFAVHDRDEEYSRELFFQMGDTDGQPEFRHTPQIVLLAERRVSLLHLIYRQSTLGWDWLYPWRVHRYALAKTWRMIALLCDRMTDDFNVCIEPYLRPTLNYLGWFVGLPELPEPKHEPAVCTPRRTRDLSYDALCMTVALGMLNILTSVLYHTIGRGCGLAIIKAIEVTPVAIGAVQRQLENYQDWRNDRRAKREFCDSAQTLLMAGLPPYVVQQILTLSTPGEDLYAGRVRWTHRQRLAHITHLNQTITDVRMRRYAQ